MTKKFLVMYRKKGFPFSSLVGDEIVEAEDVAKAKVIADERAKQSGWFVDNVSETHYLRFRSSLEKGENK